MLTIKRPGGDTTVPALLHTAGPHAGCVDYDTPDTRPHLASLVDVEVTGGDPDDLRKAAAILRARGFWLGPQTSMRCRREADRLDALAQGVRP